MKKIWLLLLLGGCFDENVQKCRTVCGYFNEDHSYSQNMKVFSCVCREPRKI